MQLTNCRRSEAPYLLQQRGTKADEAYLLGIMSSLPFDWYARRFVEITMSYGLLNAFPVPRVDQGTGSVVGPDGHAMDLSGDFRPIRTRLIEISAQLAAADKRYSEWLADVGAAPAAHVGAEARQDLIDEVNALAGLLYGLTAEHLATVFETFHAGWNHAPRLAAALAHYSKWSKMTGIAARKGRPDGAG